MTHGVDALERARRSFARRAWMDAYQALSDADRDAPLGAADLECLATAAYMVGKETDYLAVLERAYRSCIEARMEERAFACSYWLGLNLARRGDLGRANGWLARARRLADDRGGDCVEAGYLLLPIVFEHEARGDWDAAAGAAAQARSCGERFQDADLCALAGHEEGHIRVRQGRVADAFALLDEAMVAASGGELSPIVTGLVYCGVILACREAHEVHRAQEWTETLSQWCDEQSEMVAFSGRCRIHRAEILQLRGEWTDALAEARRATRRCLQGESELAAGEACYRQGEIHRLCGELERAEAGYREASVHGREPQPGLALLRLAQGRRDAAAASIARLEAEADEPFRRAGVLPAYVEIMLACGDVPAARDASLELDRLAQDFGTSALRATAALARGAVLLADGDNPAALRELRAALRTWQELAAPYEAARARELIGLACRALGDDDAADLELGAACAGFAAVGAAVDRDRVEAHRAPSRAGGRHGLTAREIEVLGLVAGGRSNREIAAALVISEHTVARHLQNIFAKLGVGSRTAAGAFAFGHGLVDPPRTENAVDPPGADW
ncbi:MAG TPA: LuxR C-terminal-related transcriptional regulator [Solirubrobacteraceae bacterium]|nr:LuxR C-terminal-related transcriptional regulator [Solirubrobacteraceae bacterium]